MFTKEHTKEGNPICDRCHEPASMIQMSWFNTDVICHKCQQKEQAHPLYQHAKEEVRRHEAMGNRNWEGIGLPDELKVKEF